MNKLLKWQIAAWMALARVAGWVKHLAEDRATDASLTGIRHGLQALAPAAPALHAPLCDCQACETARIESEPEDAEYCGAAVRPSQGEIALALGLLIVLVGIGVLACRVAGGH